MIDLEKYHIGVLGNGISAKGVIRELDERCIRYEHFKETTDIKIDEIDLLIKSPGIYYDDILKNIMCNTNILVMGDIELFYLLYPDKYYIAVTGTCGKTTVCSIIYNLLKDILNINYVGNNEITIFDGKYYDYVLVELSSFQLLLVNEFKPNIAIITNIEKAHLDYHSDFTEYENAKRNIYQNFTDELLIHPSKVEVPDFLRHVMYDKDTDIYFDKTDIYFNNKKFISLKDIKLSGSHNYNNILMALQVIKELKIDEHLILDSLKNFKGVEHRLELVYNDSLLVYNDSKSTSTYSTITALNAFDKPVYLILGGYDRNNDINELDPFLNKIKFVYLFGAIREKLANYFLKKNISFVITDLTDAVNHFFNNAKSGDILLFSPGNPSYDEYKSFVERGEAFKKIINKL